MPCQDNFIDAFEELCTGTEIPPIFAKWTAIAGAGAVLARSVYLHRGHFTLFPNFYVVLIAGSGGRKSVSIDMLEDVLRDMNYPPNIVSAKQTPERLIQELKSAHFDPEEGEIAFEGSSVGFGLFDEFLSFLNRRTHDGGLGTLLCNLYGCKREFSYGTVARGKESIKNGWFGFVGAGTPDSIRNNISEAIVQSGLASRILFVYSDQLPPPVAFPPNSGVQKSECTDLLEELKHLGGEVTLSPESVSRYTEIYEDVYWNHPFRTMPLLQPYWTRLGDHLVKIAMVLAVVKYGRFQIEPSDLDEARGYLLEIEEKFPLVMELISQTERGEGTSKVESIIRERGRVARSDIHRKVKNTMNKDDIEGAIDMLLSSGLVDVEKAGKTTYYVWKGDS